MTINDIYRKFYCTHNLQVHMIRTAKIAKLICQNLGPVKVDLERLMRACLVHDIGNTVKFDFDKYPDMIGGDTGEIEYLRKKQKELIAKYSRDDHEATKKMLQEVGFDQSFIKIVLNKTYTNATRIKEGEDWFLKILLYSDQRSGPFGVLPLKDRLDEAHKRLIKYRDRHDLYDAALEIEKQIQANVEFDLNTIGDETIKDIRVDINMVV